MVRDCLLDPNEVLLVQFDEGTGAVESRPVARALLLTMEYTR